MSDEAAIRVLIVDDEPPARRRLRALLEEQSDIEIVGECGDGVEAIDAIRDAEPDLVFLDIRMPEADGFEVVHAIGPELMPEVVFVTAYDDFALRAFEIHALDYVLKPFDRDRFQATLDRARERLRLRDRPATDDRLLALLEELRGEPADRLRRIPVKTGGRIRFVSVDELDYLEAEGNYVRLHTGADSFLIRAALGAIEARLDPARFLRIHRGLVVRLDRIRELEPLFQGEYQITLASGKRIRSSRRYRNRLHEALGIGSGA
jgi:two-component system, LytTR family, response regulator